MDEQKKNRADRRITQFIIKKLFNMFDHVINFNIEDRITIIYGVNGIGKTTILKIINDTFNNRFLELRKIPFDTIEYKFDDDCKLVITKKINKKSEQLNEENKLSKILLSFVFIDNKGKSFKSDFPFPSFEHSNFPLEFIINRTLPFLKQIDENMWIDFRSDKTYNLDLILSKYSDRIELALRKFDFLSKTDIPISSSRTPVWLKDVLDSVSVCFIESQRLLSSESMDISDSSKIIDTKKMIESVKKYSNDLVDRINLARSKYADVSQTLDRTYPTRLLDMLIEPKQNMPTKEQIFNRLIELEKERERLMNVGLVEFSTGQDVIQKRPEKSSEGLIQALSLFTDDNKVKLDTFKELARKIEIIKEIINKRFLFKIMDISKDIGFVFRLSDNKNTILKITDLSSGEQNILVIHYELLFKTPSRSLILIDEPEISLNVDWQNEFINDLQNIIDIAKLDVLIATHSPQIIHDKWDLTVKLERK